MSTDTDGAPPSVASDPARDEPPRSGSNWLRDEMLRRMAASAGGSGGRHARHDPGDPSSSASGHEPRHSSGPLPLAHPDLAPPAPALDAAGPGSVPPWSGPVPGSTTGPGGQGSPDGPIGHAAGVGVADTAPGTGFSALPALTPIGEGRSGRVPWRPSGAAADPASGPQAPPGEGRDGPLPRRPGPAVGALGGPGSPSLHEPLVRRRPPPKPSSAASAARLLHPSSSAPDLVPAPPVPGPVPAPVASTPAAGVLGTDAPAAPSLPAYPAPDGPAAAEALAAGVSPGQETPSPGRPAPPAGGAGIVGAGTPAPVAPSPGAASPRAPSPGEPSPGEPSPGEPSLGAPPPGPGRPTEGRVGAPTVLVDGGPSPAGSSPRLAGPSVAPPRPFGPARLPSGRPPGGSGATPAVRPPAPAPGPTMLPPSPGVMTGPTNATLPASGVPAATVEAPANDAPPPARMPPAPRSVPGSAGPPGTPEVDHRGVEHGGVDIRPAEPASSATGVGGSDVGAGGSIDQDRTHEDWAHQNWADRHRDWRGHDGDHRVFGDRTPAPREVDLEDDDEGYDDDGDFDDRLDLDPGAERILWRAGPPPGAHHPERGRAATGTVVVPAPRSADAPVRLAPPDPTTRRDPDTGTGSTRVRVVLSERKGIARPVRNVVELQESGTVGDLLRRNLIGSQLTVALRFAVGGGLVLGLLPLLFWTFPAIGQVAILGLRLPWLLLGVAVYPFLFSLGLWFTRTAERAEKNFADQVQDS